MRPKCPGGLDGLAHGVVFCLDSPQRHPAASKAALEPRRATRAARLAGFAKIQK